MFPENSIIKALNRCRNPSKDPRGPYCYVFSESNNKTIVEKSYCPVQLCESFGKNVSLIKLPLFFFLLKIN